MLSKYSQAADLNHLPNLFPCLVSHPLLYRTCRLILPIACFVNCTRVIFKSSKMKNDTGGGVVSRTDPRIKLITARMKKEQYKPDALIEILHTAQNAYGYLPGEVLRYITQSLHLPPSRVYSTVTFYHFFSLRSQGEHSCTVCTGTACYVKGAQQLLQALEEKYGLHPGQATTDNKLGVQVARCVGACGLAPVVIVDNDIIGKAEPHALLQTIQEKTGII